jgi:hypothetical protein
VDLSGATVEARGSTGGHAPHGGRVDVDAFNGEIIATDVPLSRLDVTGGNPADGIVNLRFCTAGDFPPGSVVGAVPTKIQNCGTHPVLPAYTNTGFFPLGPFPFCLCGID